MNVVFSYKIKLFIVVLLFIGNYSFSQKVVTFERNKGDYHKEIVTTLKSNTKILHGPYKLLTYKRVLIAEGFYKNGLKDSLWKYYYPNGFLAAKGYYKDDNKVGFWENFKEDGTIFEILDSLAQDVHDRMHQKSDSLYYVLKDSLFVLSTLDIQPKYLGGNEELFNIINQNLHIPYEAIMRSVFHSVDVSFILHKDGSVSNFKLFKPKNDFNTGFNNSILKAVFDVPNHWQPGEINGQKVTTMIIIPIRFYNR